MTLVDPNKLNETTITPVFKTTFVEKFITIANIVATISFTIGEFVIGIGGLSIIFVYCFMIFIKNDHLYIHRVDLP
jgi:hypothetical protein